MSDVDPRQVLAEARELARQGRHQEALERHVWFHEHALELVPALAGVRVSFALSDWARLAAAYPPARQALADARDRAAEAMLAGCGRRALFAEVAALNRHL